jgi:hypothetical protein
MSKSVATTSAILRAALLATTAFALAGSGAAWARVGVTSATDGDPIGKPPAEAERVLRIGIDVQANEVIRTGSNDRAHLVFLDGTALTVGPNAELTIDKFVYDPNTKTGELAVNASKGVFRLVGGKISKTNPITINTPSSTIGIRGGICVFDVQQGRTTSTFLFGYHMSVTGQGRTQDVTRPGSQVTTASGAAPSAPVMVNQGALTSQFSQLEGTSGGNGGNAGQQGGGNTAANGTNADRGAQTFAQNNGGAGQAGQPPAGAGTPPTNNPNNNPLASNPGANPNGATNSSATASTSTTATTSTVIVTSGRYLADPAYGNFNPSDLSVTPNANNNKTITSSGNKTTTTTTTTTAGGSSSSSTSTITLNVPGTGSITVPWVTGTLASGFSIGDMTALGQNLTDGMGYVSPDGQFFAYIFKVGSNKVGIFGGTPTTDSGTAGFPTSGIGAYTIGSIGDNSAIPFASNTITHNTSLSNAAVVSKLYTAYSTALQQTVGQAAPDARATALQAAVSISGTGVGQQSYMGVFVGTFYRDANVNSSGVASNDNGVALSGSYNGTYRTSTTGQIGRLTSAESTPLVANPNSTSGSSNAIYGTSGGDGVAGAIVLTSDSLTSTASVSGNTVTGVTTTRTAQASYDQPIAGTTGTSYLSVNAATATTVPTGVGTSRTTQTLNGFVGGLVEQVDANNNVSTRTIATSDPTAFALTTNATNNRASVDATVANWGTNTSATFHLGGTTGGNDASSAFIDDNTYAVNDRTAAVGNTTTIAVSSGGSSSTGVTSSTTMVSYATAPTPSLFTNAGVTACTCSFLTWGWWGGNVSYSNNSAYNPGGTDRLNFATYVAGTLSTASTINMLNSTATYNGSMVGNVNNGGSSYIAAGSYQNVWSFGSRSGAVTATFDGTTFGNGSTNTYMTGSSVNTFGTLTGQGGSSSPIVSGSKNLTINGAFFSGGTSNPVAGQAGSFAITGTSYKAGGTFAAQK